MYLCLKPTVAGTKNALLLIFYMVNSCLFFKTQIRHLFLCITLLSSPRQINYVQLYFFHDV